MKKSKLNSVRNRIAKLYLAALHQLDANRQEVVDRFLTGQSSAEGLVNSLHHRGACFAIDVAGGYTEFSDSAKELFDSLVGPRASGMGLWWLSNEALESDPASDSDEGPKRCSIFRAYQNRIGALALAAILVKSATAEELRSHGFNV